MKRYVTLFLMTIVALNMWAQHTDYRKMSALVRRAAVAADKPSARRSAGNDTRVITAFVQTTDDSVLDRYGCRKYAQLDDIAIATIPLRQLKALASHPAVLRIEAGQSSQPLMTRCQPSAIFHLFMSLLPSIGLSPARVSSWG